MIVQVDTYGSSNLVFKLAGMQEEGKFCDFSIFVSGYEIKAHKCVLAACCEYFQTNFNFPCTSKCLKKTDLTHVGCDPKYVEMVIRSFYTNEIDLELNFLESVLKLVDYLMCDILRRCIEMYMVNTLNFHTAITYFQLSLQYNLDSVKLFTYTKWLLWYRFHDYFIYHSDLNSSSVEVIESLLVSGVFHDCNPLQVCIGYEVYVGFCHSLGSDSIVYHLGSDLIRSDLDGGWREGEGRGVLKMMTSKKCSNFATEFVCCYVPSFINGPIDRWRFHLIAGVKTRFDTVTNQKYICSVRPEMVKAFHDSLCGSDRQDGANYRLGSHVTYDFEGKWVELRGDDADSVYKGEGSVL
ncbi:hypothetical protein Btru_011333 [Bulinus truncatus]|nr:hypothetical protein Btru_011333 [Bulinus truncatus]